MDRRVRKFIRLTTVAVLAALVHAAWAEESSASSVPASAADASLDVLRQRLAERLSTKKVDSTVKVVAKAGKGDQGGGSKDESARSRKKMAEPKPALALASPVVWGYAGAGAPEHWANLSPDNKLCALGTRQSPIDIRDGIKVELEKVQFDYPPSAFSVIDTGRTVQVNLAAGGSLTVMGRRFELVQFHFHRPSEERINGRGFDMGVHLVHKDAEGRLAVLAVLLERGRDQPLVQTIWNNLPLEKGEALKAPGLLDVNQLLPEDPSYFTYMGSLAEPPCSEGVLWMVMRQPVQLSANQIDIFSKLYPMNARPVQASSGRLIKESLSR